MAKLKPQDFSGLVNVDMPISTAPEKIIKSIGKRQDLSIALSNYLIKLVQYSSGSKAATKADLGKFYKKVDTADKSAIQKDFSELLAPIILLTESRQNSAKFTKLKLQLSSESKMFIPAAGNYPLVDFMIKTGEIKNQYSVKTLQKTTNTLKAGDIYNTVSAATLRKYPQETAIIKMIHENDAKLGPILILVKLANKINGLRGHKMYQQFISLRTVNNETFSKNPTDWYNFFELVVDAHYSGGKSTFNKAWRAKFYYDAITVLAQYTVADITKNMKWSPFVNEVQKIVTYFKFGLNPDGSYAYTVVNALSEQKANQSFRLRAKSRLKDGAWGSRSGQDKLGIQP